MERKGDDMEASRRRQAIVISMILAVLSLALSFAVMPVHADEAKAVIDVDSLDQNGIMKVKGKTDGTVTFEALWVDQFTRVPVDIQGEKNFSVSVDTKKYDIGYHELHASLSDDTEVHYSKVFPTMIYDKPSLEAKDFQTYTKYLTFTTPNHNGHKYDYYLQIKKGKGDWGDLYGPFSPVTVRKIENLSPGTSYTFRAVYVKEVTYGGKNYTMVSRSFSPEINVKTAKTKKLPIKSIKISKAKVKKVWVKPLYKGIVLVKEGFWTKETTYRVTVQMKKKPGVAGIWLRSGNGIRFTYLKGNKKTYKASFTVGGKAIGKKTYVQLYAQGNKTYGCYSDMYTKKKVKIKK